VAIQDLHVSFCVSIVRIIGCGIRLITLGVRKQFKDGSFKSRPSTALSPRGINRQTVNTSADVQQSPSTAGNPVLTDAPPHLSCPTCHTTPFDLGEVTKIYSPLMGDSIRLLHIRPSVNETLGLEANLIHFPLLSAQVNNYKALSYTWGAEDASVSITIDGGSMLIRPNLDKILRTLRALKYEYVWVGKGIP
jgi:hypothetical protein